MNTRSSHLNDFSYLPQTLTAYQKRWISKTFLLFTSIVVFKITNANAPTLTTAGALLLAFASLLPSYLWCSDRAKGLPLFPLLALSYLFTHGLPLISDDPAVQQYSEAQQWEASLIVASFLSVGTLIWFLFVKSEPHFLPQLKAIKRQQVVPFFFTLLCLCILFHVGQTTGYIWQLLPSSIVSALRVSIPALTSLGLVIIGYELGAGHLSRKETRLFIMLMMLLVFASGAGIYLNIPGVYVLLASLGWLFGSGKVPWRLWLIAFVIMAFLNIGKGETRNAYWQQGTIQLSEYPTLYFDWINNSLRDIESFNDIFASDRDDGLTDRASVMEMLLKVTSETGTMRPYLYGETYSIIPQLLIPRFINPNKVRGGEANHILSVYYEIKTYEETFTTSIGWGLLQEAYANFGWIGCLCLGIFLGGLYGWITQWSIAVPAPSYRFLVAIIFLVLAVRTEITMGIFVSVVWNSLLVLFAIRLFFMTSTNTVYAE